MNMVMGELENMRGRKEEWRKERRIEELEKKWEKSMSMSMKEREKGMEDLEKRIRKLKEGGKGGRGRRKGDGEKGMKERGWKKR